VRFLRSADCAADYADAHLSSRPRIDKIGAPRMGPRVTLLMRQIWRAPEFSSLRSTDGKPRQPLRGTLQLCGRGKDYRSRRVTYFDDPLPGQALRGHTFHRIPVS
jgi:hypothetical protein